MATMKTKFGTAITNPQGYYKISSVKEGNRGKFLHRLIYESVWGKIPKNWIIHHIDGNPQNNCILNLLGIPRGYHSKLHNSGESNGMYGKHISDETRRKKSNAMKGRKRPLREQIIISKSHNNTGFFRVIKCKNRSYTQGFHWAYHYYDNGKRKLIKSADIHKLKNKVEAKGLEWIILDKEKAKRVVGERNDYGKYAKKHGY